MNTAILRTAQILAINLATTYLSAPAFADMITFTGTATNPVSGGATNALQAQVTFDSSQLVLGRLMVTLSNIGPGATVPSDVLTAVLWDYSGPGSFTYPPITLASAIAPTVIGASAGTNVDLLALDEWKLPNTGNGFGNLPGVTQDSGLSTAGLGIFQGSGGQQFNYGVITGYDSPNPAVAGGTFVLSTADFVLANVPTNIDISKINNVRFQFGTALSEPSITVQTPRQFSQVPEPPTLLLIGAALLSFCTRLRRRTV